ncbi:MAG: ABC transporter substrate-binding protein [Alphaproteobacteria bacterium]|nr:ABC transporter substrate-binding protein [Alphaproteobacteria bacterium]
MRTLTVAIERYDRYLPFYDGTIRPPEGIALDIRQVGATTPLRDGKDRNRRMLIDDEFDLCEFGLSAYLMARDRGLDITALPVFPRRLFSQSQIFVHPDSGLTAPHQLIGRRIAVNSFQTSLSVLALGDLKFAYGAPWEDIIWCPTSSQMLDFPGAKAPPLDPCCTGRRQELGVLLASGEIDAFLLPRPPHAVATGTTPARRLFPYPKAAERAYFGEKGYFPIMHLMAVSAKLSAEAPELLLPLTAMFAEADAIAAGYAADPAWSLLAWGRHDAEAEAEALGGNLWPVGLEANRANIARFAEYAQDIGLIAARPDVDALFAEPVRAT